MNGDFSKKPSSLRKVAAKLTEGVEIRMKGVFRNEIS